MSNSAYHEYVAELEFIVKEAIADRTGKELKRPVIEEYADWEEMRLDPTWESDPSSAPPSFWDWLMDAADV